MKPLRVVVDCNVYVSLLIGGSMLKLRDFLFSKSVELILSNKLLAEIEEQTTKTKFAKYLTAEQASLLLELLAEVGTIHADNDLKQAISRDPDDDYLLALAKTTKAHVLLTGDRDLLVLETHGRTKIMNAKAFVKEYLG